MDYLIGGLVVWLLSGLMGIIATCMPCYDGDKWESAPIKYCLVAFILGPITHLCSAKAYNNVLFNEDDE